MMNNETGRSMVEMLGVLAIIGVLSVGGIAGYTMAMNKYRANEILNTASMMSMLAKSANGGAGNDFSTLEAAGLSAPYSGITMATSGNGGTVTVSGASSDVCNAVNASSNSSLFTVSCSGS